MRVLVLGPVEAHDDSGMVNLGGPKAKTLLAALIQQPRQVISIERLISLMWGESVPLSATALVHTYVSVLRRSFAAIGKTDILRTRAPGYLLNVRAEEIDLDAFASDLGLARKAERNRQFSEAAGKYEQALGLWRGPAFSGVDAQFARTSAAGLDADRLGAEEGLARCRLFLGRNEEVLSQLTRLVAAHPLREEARGLLMRALYDGGRQADALSVYRDGRARLMDELGVEPGEKLRELQIQILNGALNPSIEQPAVRAENRPERAESPASPVRAASDAITSTAPVAEGYVVPRHLPPDIGDFIGRPEQVATVLRLASHDVVDARTAAPIVVISGFGGAGKSTLAVHAAHLLRASYPDGQLFADLRGSDHDLSPHEVLHRFLGALGVAGTDLPDGLDNRVELYRRKVAGRRLVIVLDNARSEHQVRSLLPGDPHCLVIVTSRSRLTGLEGTEPVELGFLSTDVAVEMLSRIIGAGRVQADPAAARTIVSLCGGIPLAVRAAAAKLLARPHWQLRTLASRLSDERRRLDELAVGDLAIRSSLRLNYADLGDLQRRLFHLLTLYDLPDFGAWLAAPLLDVTLDDAEELVEQLVDLRLLDVVRVDPGSGVRYRFHDLVQLFGAEHATDNEPEAVVVSAITRTLSTWLVLVETAVKLLPRVTLGLRPRLTVDVDVDPRLLEQVERNPLEWFKSETAAVVRAVELAQDLGIDEATITLITALLSSPFAARNEFDAWPRVNERALITVRRSGRLQAEAIVLTGLGQLFYEKDDFDAALENFQHAAELAASAADEAILAVALVGMGTVRRDRAEFEQATADLVKAEALAVRTGDAQVLAAARYGLGAIHTDRGDFDAGARYFADCAELYRDLDDKRGEALTLRGLSFCHRGRNDPAAAVELSGRAVEILRRSGDEFAARYALQSLAKASIRQGRTAGIAELLDSCLELCARHGDRFGVALMVRTSGELALATGRLDRARELLADALTRWTELGLSLWQARTLRDLAAAEVDAEPALAAEHWQTALELFAATGARECAELAGMGPQSWHDQVRAVHLSGDVA